IAFTNNYLDEWDSFHLVGTLTNETEDNVVYSTSLITGLYDGNGVVLDARTSSVPMYILPGETVPFEISYFYILEEGDNMDRFETFTVQIDPYWTYEVDYDLVDLAVTNEDATYDSSGMWTIKGEVTNNSGSDLTSATVVAGLFDAEDTLVAMHWTYIWPDGEVIADGETYDFEIYIYVDPSLDPANLFYDFIVQGVLD
ncbi:MAG TPA: FxLYD domain-containing protein, partial [Anaerolineaceae bacterium]|nr:FxLYD domain-containing protein [Anaerolineaceae bacterium]